MFATKLRFHSTEMKFPSINETSVATKHSSRSTNLRFHSTNVAPVATNIPAWIELLADRVNSRMSDSNRDIPDPIKREVRQRCGFGCVLCGDPIYEYEHIVDFAIVNEHKASNITLLCPKHHSKKTRKLLTRQQVVRANARPHNWTAGKKWTSRFALEYDFGLPAFEIGSNVFQPADEEQTFMPILFDMIPPIIFEKIEGQLALTMQVFNQAGRLALFIRRNELVLSLGQWDIEWEADTLTLRTGPRDILIKLEFQVPSKVRLLSGRFFLNGASVSLTKGKLRIDENNVTVEGVNFVCNVGMAIGMYAETVGCPIMFEGINRKEGWLNGRSLLEVQNQFHIQGVLFRNYIGDDGKEYWPIWEQRGVYEKKPDK